MITTSMSQVDVIPDFQFANNSCSIMHVRMPWPIANAHARTPGLFFTDSQRLEIRLTSPPHQLDNIEFILPTNVAVPPLRDTEWSGDTCSVTHEFEAMNNSGKDSKGLHRLHIKIAASRFYQVHVWRTVVVSNSTVLWLTRLVMLLLTLTFHGCTTINSVHVHHALLQHQKIMLHSLAFDLTCRVHLGSLYTPWHVQLPVCLVCVRIKVSP